MLASDVTSGGCPPCRTLPRQDALVNAFSLLHSGKGTPDMQSLWRGYVHLTPLLGWLPACPFHTHPHPTPAHPLLAAGALSARESCLHRLLLETHHVTWT